MDNWTHELEIYDNGNTPGATCDRYTIMFENADGTEEDAPSTTLITCSPHPFSPQGVGMVDVVAWSPVGADMTEDFGEFAKWDDLPDDVQRLVRECYETEWIGVNR